MSQLHATAVARRACGILVCVGAILASAGCDLFSSSTSPSSDSPKETFSGTLAPQGSSVFTFTAAKSGTVAVTLTTLTPSTTSGVGLGFGTPNGAACTLTSSTPNATAGSAAQITVNANAGSYCVRVYDSGSLTSAATFTITVTHS